MLTELNERLSALQSKASERERIDAQLERRRASLSKALNEVATRKQELASEERDVEKLENFSFTSLVATILGDKKEKLRVEKQEALAAALSYQEVFDEASKLEQEVAELEQALHELDGIDGAYAALLEEKAAWLADNAHPGHKSVLELTEQLTLLQTEAKEIDEAERAGRRARTELNACQRFLGKARGWGVADMLGGGLITTAVKHSHINSARGQARSARRALQAFHDELSDVVTRHSIGLDLSSFAGFADYFFDGLFVDWMVQSKITNSISKVDRALSEVESSLRKLSNRSSEVRESSQNLVEERTRLLEQIE